MAFLRIKPVREYQYVYEVESYKDSRNKVKQRTVQLLGKYIPLEKQERAEFPIKRALACDSKEQLLKEIFALNFANYGFEQDKPEIFRQGSIIANLSACKVFDELSGKDVYLGFNNKFFGTQTLRKALKADTSDLFGFVKAIVDSGAVGVEFSEFKNQKGKKSHDLKLLQAIVDKFSQTSPGKNKEMNFEEFKKEVGY